LLSFFVSSPSFITGLILSSQTLGYSFGKLAGGVLTDIYSPSHLFTITLVLSAFTVILFTSKNSLYI
jgi:sugar phosphate permease